ncbi:DUF1007 family protein [Rhizobium leguminosarum]|uniref:DUF1007 family protein n=1 Tax=Rhizobium leguminosarum TaxID=384 RepID=UPI0028F40584|nr:DUF1007 family protein [Rhizobium leguminosarum]
MARKERPKAAARAPSPIECDCRSVDRHPYSGDGASAYFCGCKSEAAGGADGNLSALRHIWRFDEVFSSSVLLDFDKNENMTLDPPELEAVAETVSASLSKYSYYTNITIDGKAVAWRNRTRSKRPM